MVIRMYYINCYFFFAILGFLFETILFTLIKHPYNSSILYGPWTPIYGIAFFVIYLINHFVKKLHLSKIKELILFFILSVFILSILELIAGELILAIWHTRYWNYEKSRFNIDGFICLEISLFWGIGAIFLNYFLYPRVKNFIRKIPKWLTVLFIILFVIDTIFTILK